MPRTVSIPSQDYEPGTYGPFSANGFAAPDTDWLILSLTVEDWPTMANLIAGSLRWSTGDGADFAISSPPRDRMGNLLSVATVRVGVPRRANGKAAVNGATATLTLAAPLRTAITLSAVAE